MTMLKWIDNKGDEIGAFPEEYEDTYREFPDLLCPKCRQPCTYFEGTIDQDRMGNDIDGYWWMCHKCEIESHATEL